MHMYDYSTYISSKYNPCNGTDETPPATEEHNEHSNSNGKHQSWCSIVIIPRPADRVNHSLGLVLDHHNIVLKQIIGQHVKQVIVIVNTPNDNIDSHLKTTLLVLTDYT